MLSVFRCDCYHLKKNQVGWRSISVEHFSSAVDFMCFIFLISNRSSILLWSRLMFSGSVMETKRSHATHSIKSPCDKCTVLSRLFSGLLSHGIPVDVDIENWIGLPQIISQQWLTASTCHHVIAIGMVARLKTTPTICIVWLAKYSINLNVIHSLVPF